MINQTKPLIAALVLTASHNKIALCAGPQTLDLMGGYLFGTEQDPPSGTTELFYSLIVKSDEYIRVTNGDMTGGITGPWDNNYAISACGTLVFGPNFPNDTINISSEDTWTLDVHGNFIVDDVSITAPFNTADFLRIYPDGVMTITESGHFNTQTFMTNNGTIIVEDDAALTTTKESGITGGGTIALNNNSSLSGFLQDQELIIDGDSTVSVTPSVNIEITITTNGSLHLNLDRYDCFAQIDKSNIYIEGLSTTKTPPLTIEVNSCVIPIRDCSFTLLNSTHITPNSAHQIFSMSRQDENWAKMYSGTSFNLPAAPSGHRYQARWGVDGAYLLSTPLNWCEADLNFDGELDFFDISLFIAAYNNESVWANLQEDNRIDFFDVSTFLQAFQTTCP